MLSLFKLKSSVMSQPQKHAYAIMWIPEITVCFYDPNCIKSPNSYFGQNISMLLLNLLRSLSMNSIISSKRVGISVGVKK